MYKFIVLAALVAVAASAPSVGIIAAPYAIEHTVPVARSYANTYKVSVKSPIVAAAPIAYTHSYVAAPATYLKAAPIVAASYAHPAPLAYAGYGTYIH